MKHSDPDWYKSLKVDILKEKKFNNELMQKIKLQTEMRTKRTKNRGYYLVLSGSLTFLIVVISILYSSSGKEILNSFRSDNSSSMETSSGHDMQNDTNETQGGEAPADILEGLPTENNNLGDGSISLSEVPDNEIFIPSSIKIPSSSDKESHTSVEPTIRAENMEDVGLILRANFFTNSGVDIVLVQAPATKSEDETIRSLLNNSYPQQEKEQTKINGHVVIYVKSKERIAAHLITQNHFFTVSTTNGTIEDCFNILKQLKDDTTKHSTNRIDLSSVKEVINIPLDLADTPIQPSLSSDIQIAKLINAYGEESEHGTTIVANYQLSDGKHEVMFTQSSNRFEDEQMAVEDTKSWYNSDEVKVTKINGHAAVIDDTPDRKQVFLITDNHFYVVSTLGGALDIDDVINLAERIKLP